VRRKEAEGVSRVHHQRLLIGHLREVLHGEPVLSPVLKNSSVAAIGDELVRMLGNGRIEVVGDHQHYCGSLR